MKELILISVGMLVCFMFLALSCEKQKPHGVTVGIIWNYANASIPNYFDLPVTRSDDGGIGRPGDAAPIILMQPCNTWNSLTPAVQQQMLAVRESSGLNGCGQCHCNYIVERTQYGFYCIDSSGVSNSITAWKANPDNTVIRWRP